MIENANNENREIEVDLISGIENFKEKTKESLIILDEILKNNPDYVS